MRTGGFRNVEILPQTLTMPCLMAKRMSSAFFLADHATRIVAWYGDSRTGRASASVWDEPGRPAHLHYYLLRNFCIRAAAGIITNDSSRRDARNDLDHHAPQDVRRRDLTLEQ